MEGSTNGVPFENSWASKNGLVDVRRAAPLTDGDSVADRFAIIETVHAYAWTVDERRMDLFADLFTEDAVFEIVVAGDGALPTPSGRDPIVKWMSDYMDGIEFQMRHRMGNVLVTEQAAESASALSYLLLTSTTPESTRAMATACYSWQLRREEDRWRVAHLSAAFDRAFA